MTPPFQFAVRNTLFSTRIQSKYTNQRSYQTSVELTHTRYMYPIQRIRTYDKARASAAGLCSRAVLCLAFVCLTAVIALTMTKANKGQEEPYHGSGFILGATFRDCRGAPELRMRQAGSLQSFLLFTGAVSRHDFSHQLVTSRKFGVSFLGGADCPTYRVSTIFGEDP